MNSLRHFPLCAVAGLVASALGVGRASAQTRPAVPAVDASAEAVQLDAFTVTTSQDKGYKAANAIGATRTNTPIVDTPQSISVFNDLFIEDTLSFDLTPLTYYDPTFVPAQPDRGSYISRGFTVNATFVDGLPQRNTFGPNYTANVDRVEILKGPAAILYGQGAGGATINRVLKRARAKSSTTVTATVGDFEQRRVQLDTTGALGPKIANRPVAFRFNAAWQDGQTFKRESENTDLLYSPAFSIPLGPKTDLDLNFTYDKSNLTGNFAHPVSGGVPGRMILTGGATVQVPIDVSFGEPFDERPIEKTLTSYDLRHQFSRHLSFRSQYQFETYNQEIGEIFPQIGQYVTTAATVSIRRLYREQNVDARADRTRNEFVADFATGPLRHKALGGFSFDETNEQQLYYQNTVAAVPSINMVDPVYGAFARPEVSTLPTTTHQQTKSIARAWYVNELVSMLDGRVFLQAGYRTQDTYQRNNNRLTRAVSAVPVSAETSSFGAVWHLNRAKSLSLWAATSEAFEPNFRVNLDGATLPPTTGNTDEGGLKFDLFGSALNGTVSAFKTKRSNIAEAAPDLGSGYFRSVPGQTSQGFEVSASYNPSRQIQITGAYAYLDAFDTRTRATAANLSQDAFSGFARYEQPTGALKGAFATVGYIYRSPRVPSSGTAQPSWIVPEFKRVDLGLGYGWKWGSVSYRATCNLENATDDLLFGDNNQNDRYGMLAPRTWRFSLRMQF